ncbi:hypothetical protein MTR67_039230 [Solanum verrucosum]|uniref:Uncharacterized protein n=1 Tax=Solanum verrucosum TaxID=315347 RepID=A0AAF0ZQG6_SOLVR|nr:hypothetical protein MTR67_039230 [Solanum verrucosum]
MMTQMDLLTKHAMGSGYKAVNAVGINSGVNPNEVYSEAMYNEVVHFLPNQTGGSRLSYPKLEGNLGWNRDQDYGWRDGDRELCDCGTN